MTDKHKIYIIILWFSMRIYCKKNEFDIYNSLEVSHLPRFLEFSRMCGLQRALKSLNPTATAACHFALGPVYIRSFSMADEGSYLTHCHTHAHSLAVHRKTSVCPRQMVGRLRLWIEWVFNVGLRKFFIIFFFFFLHFLHVLDPQEHSGKKKIFPGLTHFGLWKIFTQIFFFISTRFGPQGSF